MEDDALVTNEDDTKVADATIGDGEVAVDATQATSTDDVEAKLEEQKERFDTLQNDLNAMKSSFQKRESQLTKEWDEKEVTFREEAQKLKMATMNDEDRQVYERSLATERLAELERKNSELIQAQENQRAQQDSLNYFLSKGIALDSLVVDQGYDALIASGWKAFSDEKESLQTELDTLRQNPKKDKSPAPEVITDLSGATPTDGPTWQDLIKKYGSMEEVYSLVESQQLPSSIIPA